ncbi:hypothetical protein CANARDRAFT_180323, partial [[Candida] arabinofermentans NRRL YB-2248]
ITKDNSYMSFFQSYSESATANKKMKSVEETKSFNKMFQYLLQSKGTGGVTPALQDLALLGVNVDLTDKDFTSKRRNEKFSLTGASTENALEAFKENSQNNQSVMEQLMPTLQYIETNINNTQEMFDFIQVKLIDRFSEMHSQSNEKPILSQTLEKTEQASLSDPSSPYMDIYTLPVLLQYCFNSLTYDFDSLEETLLFVDNIKKHNSVFVYEFGFNINVYNSLITQAWDKTKNLGLIGRLVDELKINAIQPNLLTFKVLSEIYLKCMSVNDGLAAEPYLLWGDNTYLAMLLTPKEFSKAFDDIKQTSLTHSTCKLVIFVSCLNVDAICGGKMIAMLLKRHLIVFQLIPVVGYNDMKGKYQKLDESISNIILIGCGSMVDLESFLEIDVNDHLDQDYYGMTPITPDSTANELKLNRKIYVIDGHRPWNLDNVFGSQIVSCFDDGVAETELAKERDAYAVLINADSEVEEEDDEDELEEEAEYENLATDDDEQEGVLTDEDGDGPANSRKRKASSTSKKSRKKMISSNEKTIEEYYNQGTTVSTSAALQVYSLISAIGETNIDYLWLSIVGTSSLVSSFNSIYNNLLPLLKEEVNRLQTSAVIAQQQQQQDRDNANTTLDGNRAKNADNKALQVDRDYSLFLLRHWNLYNAFFYSSYVSAKLQLYTNSGKKKLNTMFARMGISLVQANQNWSYLDIELKKKLHGIFNKTLKEFGLTDVLQDGFVRSYGFHGSISATDYIESVTALLEYDGDLTSNTIDTVKSKKSSPTTPEDMAEDTTEPKDIGSLISKREAQFVTNFWKAYDSLERFAMIKKGVQIAKVQQQFIFEKGFEIFQKKMIKNLRIFRLVVLKDNFASSTTILEHSSQVNALSGESENDMIDIKTFSNGTKLFQNPLILTRLGNWILEACAELDKSLLPLVIASLDVDTGTYLVCGLPPKYPNMKGMDDNGEDSGKENLTILNTFSLAFQEIANSTGAKARIDSFESSMIELRKEDLPMFLERLSLSGLV